MALRNLTELLNKVDALMQEYAVCEILDAVYDVNERMCRAEQDEADQGHVETQSAARANADCMLNLGAILARAKVRARRFESELGITD